MTTKDLKIFIKSVILEVISRKYEPPDQDYGAASDFLERRDSQLMDLASLLKQSKGKGRVPWKTVPASLLKKVWLLFGRTGRINKNDIDKINGWLLFFTILERR